MKLYIGVTDNNWYNYLKTINPEDVNFWQPGGNANFRILSAGGPFLFKLKSPINKIGGIGFFSSQTFLPINIAWDVFSDRNGCESFDRFKQMILQYRTDKQNFNPTIGCIVLTNPIFFEPEDWLDLPTDWSINIVQGKSYDSESSIGAELWRRVEELLYKYLSVDANEGAKSQLILEDTESPRYGNSILTKVRLGQGA